MSRHRLAFYTVKKKTNFKPSASQGYFFISFIERSRLVSVRMAFNFLFILER